jgi:hypothetical protein
MKTPENIHGDDESAATSEQSGASGSTPQHPEQFASAHDRTDLDALRERLTTGVASFADVILLKHWQTLDGDANRDRRTFGGTHYYQALENFKASRGGTDLDVAVFGSAAMGVFLSPDGTFKWTVIARTIRFDWSEAYRLAYRVDAVAEQAREWWGGSSRVGSPSGDFADQVSGRTGTPEVPDSNAPADPVAPDDKGWRQRRELRAHLREAKRRRKRLKRQDTKRQQAATELRPHLDRAYSLLSAIFSAVNRENLQHDEHGKPNKLSNQYQQNLAVLYPEVKTAEVRFGIAAQRDAQILYGRGMIWGAAALAGLCIGVGILFLAFDVPAVSGVAFPAGAVGGMMSVLQRMTSRSLELDFNAGKRMLVAFGAVRPMVGGVLGLALFCLLKGGLLPAISIATKSPLAFYSGAGFLAGFNERFAQDTLAGSARRLTGYVTASQSAGIDAAIPE